MDKDLLDHSSPPLFPDLLSSEQLLFCISMRYSSIRHLKDKSHSQLVDFYRQMILPLAQREYRLNRRGRFLTKKRIASGLQAASGEELVQNISSTFNTCTTTTLTTKRPHNRLKPPPEVLESKRIRLSSGSNSDRSDVDASSVKSRKSEKDIKDEKNTALRKRSESSSHESSDASKAKRVKITWP